MGKLWAAALSLLTGLGMVGALQGPNRPQDPPKPPAPPEKVETRIGAKDVTVSTNQDPAAVLREAYEMLHRLRAERLDDHSKQMVDQATELYRRALKSYEVLGREAGPRGAGPALGGASWRGPSSASATSGSLTGPTRNCHRHRPRGWNGSRIGFRRTTCRRSRLAST